MTTTDAAWLRTARERLGLTQAELADALGSYQSVIAKMEAGRRPVRRVVRLAVEGLISQRVSQRERADTPACFEVEGSGSV